MPPECFHLVRELHARTNAVQKRRHYLLGSKFIIETDQKSLKELLTQTIQTSKQHFFLSKLMGSDCDSMYKPGKENQAADAVSWKEMDSIPYCMILSVPIVNLSKQLKLGNENLSYLQVFHQELLYNSADHASRKCINGILYKDVILLLTQHSPLKHTSLK